MQYRIEVIHKKDCKDPEGMKALGAIRNLGISAVSDVRAVSVFLVDGRLGRRQVRTLTEGLFVDPIVQQYRVCGPLEERWPWAEGKGVHSIEVKRRPGVMDPVQQSAMKGAADLGLGKSVRAIRTATKYLLRGGLTREQLERIAWKALANATIE